MELYDTISFLLGVEPSDHISNILFTYGKDLTQLFKNKGVSFNLIHPKYYHIPLLYFELKRGILRELVEDMNRFFQELPHFLITYHQCEIDRKKDKLLFYSSVSFDQQDLTGTFMAAFKEKYTEPHVIIKKPETYGIPIGFMETTESNLTIANSIVKEKSENAIGEEIAENLYLYECIITPTFQTIKKMVRFF